MPGRKFLGRVQANKMLLLRGETKCVFLVIWGDCKLWAPGFKHDQQACAAERYDGMCAEMLDRASQLDIPAKWLRFEDRAALEHPPNDSWHVARELLQSSKDF